jgi:peptidoglycan-associated lipoprotein
MVALLALSVAACRKKPVVQPEPIPNNPPARTDGNNTGSTPAPAPTTNRDSIERFNAAVKATEASLMTAIYFDYDVAELSVASRNTLETKAQILRDNPDVRIRIEGNADNRGSNEYNLALGQRRAAAARDYLVSRGIAASRIETVSLGEEKPAVQGEDESAWSKNRRDEFAMIAGSIKKPLGD